MNVSRRLILACAGGLAAAPAVNLAFDPFGVLGATWWTRQSPSLNERVWKIEQISRLEQAPQVLLMGSSVTDMLPVAAARQRLNMVVFNAAVFSGTPASTLAILQVLDQRGKLPRKVIMGLEPLAFHDPDRNDLSTRDHWQARGEHQASYLLPYLFSLSGTEMFSRLMAQTGELADVRWDPATGQCLLDEYEAQISRDPKAFSDKHFSKPLPSMANCKMLDSRFAALASLAQFAHARGITLIAFVSPLPYFVRASYGAAFLVAFIERASKALGSSLLDLSSLLDGIPYCWYDSRHYRPRHADLVMSRVLKA